MRPIVCVVVVTFLLAMPFKCHGQSADSVSRDRQHPPATLNEKQMPRVQITLKNGQKLVGRWAGSECDSNCQNCRGELVQKGSTRTIYQSDVAKIENKRTFWETVGLVLSDIGLVVSAPVWMLLLYVGCRNGC